MNQGDKLYKSSHWVREKMKLNMSKRLYSKNSLGKKKNEKKIKIIIFEVLRFLRSISI